MIFYVTEKFEKRKSFKMTNMKSFNDEVKN